MYDSELLWIILGSVYTVALLILFVLWYLVNTKRSLSPSDLTLLKSCSRHRLL